MPDKVDLSKGGVAIVLVGTTGHVKEYETHPAIKFLDCKTLNGQHLAEQVPENTKGIIICEGIPQYHYTWATSYCNRKQIPWLVRKSNQAVYETLKGFFPVNGTVEEKVSQEEAEESFKRGKLDPLIPFIDFSKSNSENGRELERKSRELGIRTTLGSLTQLVANKRRAQGQTAVPKSVRSKLDLSVEMLDKMIEELGSMRDYLIETTEENRILKAKYDKLKSVIEG